MKSLDQWTVQVMVLNARTREKNLKVVALLADLFRIIILSSSLLLVMCPWREDPTNTSNNTQELQVLLTNERAENLCQNINRSILLLKTLSHFSYLFEPIAIQS